jgi:hypothetical protein
MIHETWDAQTGLLVSRVETPAEPDPLVVLAEQVTALTDAVDTLILDQLGGFDV